MKRVPLFLLSVLFVFFFVRTVPITNEIFKDATPEELALKSATVDPGASAAILFWSDTQDDQQAYESEYYRIKIFTAEGRKFGDIEIPFLKEVTSIKDIKARTIKPDGTSVPFDGKVFEKVILKGRRFSIMAKAFTMPQVEPGSILEYRFVRSWDRSTIYNSRWVLQRELPILKAKFQLNPYTQDYSSYFVLVGVPPGKEPVRVGKAFEMELTDMPAFQKEAYAPPDDELKPRVEFFYTLTKINDVDRFWADAAKAWAKSIENFVKGKELQETVTSLVAGATTDDAKLKAIYNKVQQLENLSFAKETTAQEQKADTRAKNKKSEDVLRNGYGRSWELNRLFVTMARLAGFDAGIVRVAPRDDVRFQKNYPNERQLDTEVAWVTVGGKDRFFDPGTPRLPFGILPWEDTGVVSMRLDRTGGAFITMPDQGPTLAQMTRRADLKLEGDQLVGSATISFAGLEAHKRRIASLHDDEAAKKKSLEDEVKGWFPDGSNAKLTKVTGLDGIDEPIVATFDLDIANGGSVTGSRAMFPLAVFSSTAKNPFTSQKRTHSITFEYQYTTDDEVKLHVPAGYAVESLPGGSRGDLGAAAFESSSSVDSSTVTLKRKVDLKWTEFDPTAYRTLRNFFTTIEKTDRDSLVLRKAQ